MNSEVSNINSIGFSFILVASALIIFLPRRYAIIPMICAACYITLGQVVNVAGLNFTAMRILVLAGWVRVVARGEASSIRINVIDKLVILFAIASVVTYTLLWQTSEALVNRLGYIYNVIGIYFLFRFLVRDLDDVIIAYRTLAIIIVPLALTMLIEKTTGRNLFSVFGGVPEFTMVREGKLRCQGPFGHPILAGTFGATLVPLFVGLWFRGGRNRRVAVVGLLAATAIALTPASNGPVLAYVFALVGLILWHFRSHLRVIRWGTVIALVGLHLVMKAPVWYLINRIGEIMGGGGGFHRSELINQAISHFGEWWFLGTTYTAHWMPYFLPSEPNMVDITNQFIFVGVYGGILPLTLFIVVIALCFRVVGRALRAATQESMATQMIIWSLGAALFAHVVSFLSIAYFDQMVVAWYLVLAMISAVANPSKMAAEPIVQPQKN